MASGGILLPGRPHPGGGRTAQRRALAMGRSTGRPPTTHETKPVSCCGCRGMWATHRRRCGLLVAPSSWRCSSGTVRRSKPRPMACTVSALGTGHTARRCALSFGCADTADPFTGKAEGRCAAVAGFPRSPVRLWSGEGMGGVRGGQCACPSDSEVSVPRAGSETRGREMWHTLWMRHAEWFCVRCACVCCGVS